MTLDDLIFGDEAAQLVGVRRPDTAWRIMRRARDEYQAATGREVRAQMCGLKCVVVRDDWTDFAAWYRARTPNRAPKTVHPYHASERGNSRTAAATQAKRRRNLRAAILRLKEQGR